MHNVAIIGAGKVGSVLGRILVEDGGKVVCVVSKTKKSAQVAGRLLRCRNVSDSLTAIPSSTDLIYITTPHAEVEEVAVNISRLEHLRFSRLSVCHASGMLTARTLEPLARKGATVFSFHPLQTFPRDFKPQKIVPSARGIFYAVDGSAVAIRKAKQFAGMLKGHVIEISPEMRVFYHASCVVASNHLTSLLADLEVMYNRFGNRRQSFLRVFKPIIAATLRNVEDSSPSAALSGPVARGGIETVDQHFAAVRRFAPELLPYFGTLTLETVRLAERKGSLSGDRAQALKDLVHSYTSNQESR